MVAPEEIEPKHAKRGQQGGCRRGYTRAGRVTVCEQKKKVCGKGSIYDFHPSNHLRPHCIKQLSFLDFKLHNFLINLHTNYV